MIPVWPTCKDETEIESGRGRVYYFEWSLVGLVLTRILTTSWYKITFLKRNTNLALTAILWLCDYCRVDLRYFCSFYFNVLSPLFCQSEVILTLGDK